MEIADSLQIRVVTVNSYIRRIYEKLHVRSRMQAVAKYAHFRAWCPGVDGQGKTAVDVNFDDKDFLA